MDKKIRDIITHPTAPIWCLVIIGTIAAIILAAG